MPTTHHFPNVLLPHHDYPGTTDDGPPEPAEYYSAMDSSSTSSAWQAAGESEEEEEVRALQMERKNVRFGGAELGGEACEKKEKGGGVEEDPTQGRAAEGGNNNNNNKNNKRKRKKDEGEAGEEALLVAEFGSALIRPRPRRGILKKRLRVVPEAQEEEEEGHAAGLGMAWSFSLAEGEVDKEDAAADGEEDTTEDTGVGPVGATTQGQGTLTYMDDAQALEFLTSPAVLEAWPFMSDIHFLVTVITDMRLPDYPVIYASDSFEGLTLYEKLDILGSNCRILQGKCTNKQTVEMLSTAIHSGEQVEAHLLNYRKDGTPFWNKFMALPIKDSDSGVVTHYVGIQQDVTLLTEMGSDPRQWTSPEVGMWLDHVDLGDYSLKAVQQDLIGADLFSEEFESLAFKLNMTNAQDLEYLRRKVKRLKRNPQLSFSSSFSSFDFSHSAISLHLLSQTGPKKVRFDPKTFYHPDAQDKVTVRCFHRDRLHLFSIHKNTSFSRLRNKIKSILPRLKCSIQQIYEDPEFISGSATAIHSRGNVEARRLAIFAIRSDEELAQAIARVTGARSHLGCGAPVMRIRLVPADAFGVEDQLQLLGPPLSVPSPFSFSLTSASSSASSSSSLSSSMSSLLDPSTSLLSTSSFFSASLPGTSPSSVLPSFDAHHS